MQSVTICRMMAAHLLLSLLPCAWAELHHLFVGGFGNNVLHSVEFDDQALTLKSSIASSGHGAHPWIAFDHAKKNLYGASGSSIASYSVLNGSSLRFDGLVSSCSTCTGSNLFVVAAQQPPYTVYSCTFSPNNSYTTVFQVDGNGTLASAAQVVKYSSDSAVHGLSLSRDQSYLYSADDTGNAVWTHKIQPNGTLTYVGKLTAPSTKSDPRHATTHPNGTYLYVVLEGSNQIAVYPRDSKTGELSNASQIFSLLPTGLANASYWADEVVLSPSNKYLWATTRARDNSSKGYISAFSLSATGEVSKQLFLIPTTSSGGAANAITPAFFSDELLALTDSSKGFVEIWKFSSDTATAKAVAHIDFEETGCCANAIWYD